jgi:hypothetical protein
VDIPCVSVAGTAHGIARLAQPAIDATLFVRNVDAQHHLVAQFAGGSADDFGRPAVAPGKGRAYMRNRSPANSADSSPPVPARSLSTNAPARRRGLGDQHQPQGPSIWAIKCILAAFHFSSAICCMSVVCCRAAAAHNWKSASRLVSLQWYCSATTPLECSPAAKAVHVTDHITGGQRPASAAGAANWRSRVWRRKGSAGEARKGGEEENAQATRGRRHHAVGGAR